MRFRRSNPGVSPAKTRSYSEYPEPDTGTCCGLPPPLSLTETSPLKLPIPSGLKVTLIVQGPPATTLAPQVFVWEKAVEPEIVMLPMLSAVLPGLLSVVVSVLEPPLFTVPKLRLAGLNSTTVPVPVRLTVSGLPAALSVIDNVPPRVPRCVALKVTLMVQLASAARLEPQVFVWLKSPLAAILAILSAILP